MIMKKKVLNWFSRLENYNFHIHFLLKLVCILFSKMDIKKVKLALRDSNLGRTHLRWSLRIIAIRCLQLFKTKTKRISISILGMMLVFKLRLILQKVKESIIKHLKRSKRLMVDIWVSPNFFRKKKLIVRKSPRFCLRSQLASSLIKMLKLWVTKIPRICLVYFKIKRKTLYSQLFHQKMVKKLRHRKKRMGV